MKIAVVAVQGAFTEHRDAFEAALRDEGLEGDVVLARRPEHVADADAVALPGGESTAISKLLQVNGLHDLLVRRAVEEDLPILGTCAGLVLLAKEGDGQVQRTETRLLGLMDMAVNRNAFGRQRESFEADVHLKGLDDPVPAAFIRAPAITRTWGACEALGTVEVPVAVESNKSGLPRAGGPAVVAAREGNRFALSFHPELTPDTAFHRWFLRHVATWQASRPGGP